MYVIYVYKVWGIIGKKIYIYWWDRIVVNDKIGIGMFIGFVDVKFKIV